MLMFKRVKLKSTLPQFRQDLFTLKSDIHPYETRGASGIHIIQRRTNYRKFSFHSSPHLWNSLLPCLTNTKSILQFEAKYKHYLINTKLITN